MGKKCIKILIMLGCITLFFAGCSSKRNAKKQNENTAKESKADQFPSAYQHKSDRVEIKCNLEIPKDFNIKKFHEIKKCELKYVNEEKAVAQYVKGKQIKEKFTNPATDNAQEENGYTLEDGTNIDIGDGFTFGSKNFKYYGNVGIADGENQEVYSKERVNFASAKTCIKKVEQAVQKLDYPVEEFEFVCYPLNHKVMKTMEEKYMKQQLIEKKDQKGQWTSADDAYMIYAFQKKEKLPVFHELMSIERQFAYDTPDNAPIQAIYSSRGMESLMINNVYTFSNSSKVVTLKNFDEIAKVVEDKFNNVLNDKTYTVNRAKLCERVYKDKNQKYKAEPVWYFEVMESGTKKSVTLVNAETGKERYLK